MAMFERFWRWVGKNIVASYPKQNSSLTENTSGSLKQLLRTEERNYIERVSAQFNVTESWRFWFNLILIPGGALCAGISKIYNDSFPELLGPLTVAGIVSAFVGGVLIALVDRSRGKLITETQKSLDLAFDSLNQSEILTAKLKDYEQLDDRR